MTEGNSTKRVKAHQRTFDILDVVQDDPGLTLTEIADELGMSKSTVHLHLSTLDELGLVTKKQNRHYLGLRFLGYGIQARASHELYGYVRNKVDDLAEETGELVGCFVEENGYSIYMYADKGKNAVNTDLYVGKRTYLHCTAGGKAILAHYDDERVAEIVDTVGLPAMTGHSIADVDELHAELAEIRERGVAVSREESIRGMFAVASPVLVDDHPMGSISVCVPVHRTTDQDSRELTSLVKGAANEIQLNLEHTETIL